MPNEILLIIFNYLTPAHVLKAFLNYDDRILSCVSEYREIIDLSLCSYPDFQYFLMLLLEKNVEPLTLVLSNDWIPTQIEMFFDRCHRMNLKYVQDCSLLECTQTDLAYVNMHLSDLNYLQSLCIVMKEPLDQNENSMNYSIIKTLRDIMFNSKFNKLTELNLSVSEGIILDKQLHPNIHLTCLTISLQQIDDLLILFDGLVPNLTFLDVTICQSDISSVSRSWSHLFMSHLVELRLTTCKEMSITFKNLYDITMPLNHVEKLMLDVEQWNINDNQFVDVNQINMLIRQHMPCLQHFHYYIETTKNINQQVNFSIIELIIFHLSISL